MQIKALVADLDTKEKKEFSKVSTDEIYNTLVQSRLELSSVCQDRVNFRFEIDEMIVSACVKHVPHELRAILGNVVNNSIDAISGMGEVTVKATEQIGFVEITVQDNGKGIPEEFMPKIFDDKFTHGKTNGSGIGLFHSKNWLEKWNGNISVSSKVREGTLVKITIPIEERKPWYVSRLRFSPTTRVIILDDQQSGRDLWLFKLREHNALLNVDFYSDPDKVPIADILASSQDDLILLFDYDLGAGKKTGLDLLKQFPITAQKFLVTGHFDQSEIHERCETEGVFLIPKTQINDLRVVMV